MNNVSLVTFGLAGTSTLGKGRWTDLVSSGTLLLDVSEIRDSSDLSLKSELTEMSTNGFSMVVVFVAVVGMIGFADTGN